MRIGQKVTLIFRVPKEFAFLRCYVIRRVSNGWQLYDPVRNYSWGLDFGQEGNRVVVA